MGNEKKDAATLPQPPPRSQTIFVIACLLVSAGFCLYRVVPIFANRSEEGTVPAELTSADFEKALSDLDARQHAAALTYIERSTGNVALSAPRSILQGRLFLEGEKPFAARQTFESAAKDKELAPLAVFWLGATSYALGDLASAETYWLDAAAADPKHVDTHRSLSMIYYDRGAIDHAVHHLKQTSELDETDARPHRLLGLIHKDYEKYSEASAYYTAALARQLSDDSREEVLAELAECLIKTRNYEESLSVLRKMRVATPESAVLQADCLVGLGRSGEATKLLTRLLADLPDCFPALVARAGIHVEQQEPELAVQLLKQAIAINPTDYLANFRLSQALRRTGDVALADATAARAEELKAMRERFSKLHQDAADRPLDAEVRFQLGEQAQELEMFEIAETWYEAALQLDANHALAREKLDELKKKHGSFRQ